MKSREQIRAEVRRIIASAQAEIDLCIAAGICIEPGCVRPLAGQSDKFPCGDLNCEEHAREFELEMLVEDQEDDAAGRMQ